MDRILIIADINAPYRVEVFKGLAQEFDTTVFFCNGKNQSRHPAWYVLQDDELSFDILDNEEALAHYRQCLREIRSFRIVLCYTPWSKKARALQRLCHRKGVPIVLNADGALHINRSFPKKQIKTFYTKRAALCFAGCERAAEYFRTYGAKDEAVVKHPFTSIHRDRLLPAPLTAEEKARLKEELGISPLPVFISVGQFIHRKGLDLLLEAWSKTDQEAAQLYLVGGGPQKEEYDGIIAQKQLKNVHVMDFLPPDVLFRYYMASDAYVMPTREDIWGLVINEAMASGLPIISSDRCTAANELISKDKNGILYPCEDTDRLAAAITRLASDSALRERFGAGALDAIRDHVFENVIQSHVENLRKI